MAKTTDNTNKNKKKNKNLASCENTNANQSSSFKKFNFHKSQSSHKTHRANKNDNKSSKKYSQSQKANAKSNADKKSDIKFFEYKLLPLSKIKDSSPVGRVIKPSKRKDKNSNIFEKNRSHIDTKIYKYVVYDTFENAKNDLNNLKDQCKDCDRLDVVIKQEGDMNDKDITAIDKKIVIYAGQAWYLIHTRRISQKWYEDPNIGFKEKC